MLRGREIARARAASAATNPSPVASTEDALDAAARAAADNLPPYMDPMDEDPKLLEVRRRARLWLDTHQPHGAGAVGDALNLVLGFKPDARSIDSLVVYAEVTLRAHAVYAAAISWLMGCGNELATAHFAGNMISSYRKALESELLKVIRTSEAGRGGKP